MFKRLLSLKKKGLDFFLPPLCLKCSCYVSTAGTLCSSCWSQLTFISYPYCDQCGIPFMGTAERGTIKCGSCLSNPPLYKALRAPLVYTAASRSLILALKYGDRTDLAPWIGLWMNHSLYDIINLVDVVVPVPLHKKRLQRRQYNQSALLAQVISRERGLTLSKGMLIRCRETPSQGGLTFSQRRENVRGAFQVSPRQRRDVQGSNVLLVDDVFTTGATIHACTDALHKAGAKDVFVSVACRVLPI